MGLYQFGYAAMATTFEIVIRADEEDETYAGQAADAAFAELVPLEAELSRYKEDSDIRRLERQNVGEWRPIGMAGYDCLALSKAVNASTGGAFDVTIGPLMAVWRTRDGAPRRATEEEANEARTRCGCNGFELDREEIKARVLREGMRIDLGGVGKGYALDQMAARLGDWGIGHALLNSGDSTVLALGDQVEEVPGWIVNPAGAMGAITTVGDPRLDPEGRVHLIGSSLSGSGFAEQGEHIMDPRLGYPVPRKRGQTWAVAPNAALSDALSTAFSVMDEDEISGVCEGFDGIAALFEAGARGN